jgi:hypothetical protein
MAHRTIDLSAAKERYRDYFSFGFVAGVAFSVLSLSIVVAMTV